MDIDDIVKIAQIASCLEVSGYPKPGNVHRTRDFHDMVFEDFIISGIVIGDTIRKACQKGLKATKDKKYTEIGAGELILEAVTETDKWIANNTNLGIVMLTIPISIATAMSNSFQEIQDNIGLIMNNTTSMDAVNLYKAINIADAGGMGDQEEYDVSSNDSLKELIETNTTMYDVLEISSEWDKLALELTTQLELTFNIGYPTFKKIKQGQNYNLATLTTFLTLLSQIPDTLISRKYGEEKAEEVSQMAKKILEKDISTKEGQTRLKDFDEYLFTNKLNPGTTADLTAASIMLSLLSEKI